MKKSASGETNTPYPYLADNQSLETIIHFINVSKTLIPV
jgi:hypothetical protein